jgi:hypothetical protein
MNEYEKLRNLNKFKKWKFKEGLEKFSYRNVMLNHTGTGNVTTPPSEPSLPSFTLLFNTSPLTFTGKYLTFTQ